MRFARFAALPLATAALVVLIGPAAFAQQPPAGSAPVAEVDPRTKLDSTIAMAIKLIKEDKPASDVKLLETIVPPKQFKRMVEKLGSPEKAAQSLRDSGKIKPLQQMLELVASGKVKGEPSADGKQVVYTWDEDDAIAGKNTARFVRIEKFWYLE